MNRFQKLALTTIAATYLLIALGGFVRAAGAGLGCPDWPKCFGRWVPPTNITQLPDDVEEASFNFKLAWIEYVNRLVGVVIGGLILATALVAWLDHRQQRSILLPSIIALMLVVFQGWFGGQVVAYELDPRFVTVHLFVAIAIIGTLIYGTVMSFVAAGANWQIEFRPKRLDLLAYLASAACVVQILLGALVRGNIDLITNAKPNLERGLVLGHVGWLDEAHRTGGLVVVGCCLALAICARSAAGPKSPVGCFATLPFVCALIQFGVGAGLAYLALPPSLQVIHILAASLLFGSLLVVILVHRCVKPAA